MAKAEKSPKWKWDHLVDAYVYSRAGHTDADIAKLLGVSRPTFYKWIEEIPELKLALHKGRAKPEDGGYNETFPEYVYRHLSQENQKLFDKIEFWNDQEGGIDRIEEMLSSHQVRVRQQLFVHALVKSAFNLSEACRMVAISKGQFDKWLQRDPDFVELMNEIQWHKKNFFEQCLVGLVRDGNPHAVIHVNKTLNKDRGYGDKMDVKVEHSGTVQHMVAAVPIAELNLPLDVKVKILDAMEERKERLAKAEAAQQAIPVSVKALPVNRDEDQEEDEAVA